MYTFGYDESQINPLSESAGVIINFAAIDTIDNCVFRISAYVPSFPEYFINPA
jgi:hypothetical protein